jgi:cytochrome bd-type quinol oxidase subunit 1
MKRGTLGWFQYRMVSGAIFSVLGCVIVGRLLLYPGPPQSKIVGLAFALAAIALGIVRIVQYWQVRQLERQDRLKQEGSSNRE